MQGSDLVAPAAITGNRVVRALAGPALIVVSVVVVMHFFVFSGLVSRQNPDILPLWLPTYCLMGKSLAAGHILSWNPHTMAGAPFAADPQSGWMYLPAMLLFSALSCGAAIRWFIVLQPLIAGLALYGFARSEGLSRPAATVAGLALSLPFAGSQLGLSLPFSASIAWTAVVLLCASRLMRSASWSGRLAWVALTALAWGQLAAAHLSNGLVLGTVALVVYLATRIVADRGVRGSRLGSAALLLLAFPLVNLAYLFPRLAYLPRTSLGLGYDRLEVLGRAFSGSSAAPLPGGAIRSTLPLRFVASPGVYLGAAALALVFAGWRSRHRALAVGTGVFGLLCYLASLQGVVDFVARHFRHAPLADFYLREPARFSYGLLIAIAILAGIGLDAWVEASSWRQRAWMVGPAVVVWLALPIAFNADLRDLRLFFVAVGVTAVVLALVARRPALAALVPVALAAELVTSGLAGETSSGHPEPNNVRNQMRLEPLYPLAKPDVHVGDFLRPGPIARALEGSSTRYLSIDPAEWDPRGLHVHQDPRSWGLMAMNRSMLFDLEEAQGYNATEERRYWIFTRAVDPRPLKYNASYFMHPDHLALALDLLDVGWIVAPAGTRLDVPGTAAVLTEGRWTLYRIAAPPRAQLFPSWVPVQDGTEALDALRSGDVDPSTEAVVEIGGFDLQPGHGPPGGRATYRWLGSQEARIDVDSPGLAALVVRNAYDPNWHATLDGRPVSLLHMDYLLQGLFVSKGRHTVILRYDDPAIGSGLVASGVVLVLLLEGALVLRRRERRRADVGESAADADDDRAVPEAP